MVSITVSEQPANRRRLRIASHRDPDTDSRVRRTSRGYEARELASPDSAPTKNGFENKGIDSL
jgi:hypothetical protein